MTVIGDLKSCATMPTKSFFNSIQLLKTFRRFAFAVDHQQQIQRTGCFSGEAFDVVEIVFVERSF